jgi:ornithine cyclodeaminase/alanine dehydrogenase-like protein (mu-crystallin family)
MKSGDLLLLRGDEIAELFRGQEAAIIEAVGAAYVTQERGDVSMPNCAFLRFPDNETDRIIPKPAFLGGFIRATIGAILGGKPPARAGDRPVMFNPFGLGILDLAVAHLACRLADRQNAGTVIGDFLPTTWTARHY